MGLLKLLEIMREIRPQTVNEIYQCIHESLIDLTLELYGRGSHDERLTWHHSSPAFPQVPALKARHMRTFQGFSYPVGGSKK